MTNELLRVARVAAAMLPLALPLLAPPVASAGEAKGKMTVKGETHELKYAYAIARPGFFDKTKEDIEILLTSTPVPDSDLGDVMPGSGPRLSMTVNEQKEIISGNVFYDSGNLSSNSGHNLELTSFDGKKVAGRLFTKGTVEGAGTKFSYDVTFSADVFRKPKYVPPTAADMKKAAASPQAKVFNAYLKAIHASDFAALRKIVEPEMAKQMDDPQFKEMFPLMKEMTPKTVEFLRVTENGDAATLEMKEKELGMGTSELRKIGGEWRLGGTKWTMSSE